MSIEFSNVMTNEDGAPEIRANELTDQLENPEIQIVDVRRPDEWTGELGHIANAKLITLETELESRLSELDPNKTTVFVCRSGKRSSRATLLAQEKGFKSVFNLEGGMLKWNALELPRT